MKEKINKLYFGNSTIIQLETEKTPFELLDIMNRQTSRSTNLKDNFYSLSDKLAYHFEPKQFGKPANLTIKFVGELQRTFSSTFDRVYPTFKGSLKDENSTTQIKGTVGFSIFTFLRSIYSELVMLMFFIIFMIAPELQEHQTFVVAGFVILTLLSVLKHIRIKKRIEFMNREITRIVTEY